MKVRVISICALIVAISLLATSVLSITINVPADQPTIQDGIIAANGGDTVLVAAGTYIEEVNFLGKSVCVLSADGPQATVITGNSEDTLVFFGNNEGPDAILQGFTLSGGRFAIRCANAGPTIRFNIMDGQTVNNWAAVVFAGHGYGIVGPSPAIFTNNTIVNSANGGLSSFSTESPFLRNNIIAFNSAYGIHDDAIESSMNIGYDNIYGNTQGDYLGSTNAGSGPGEISEDPLFLDEEIGDYSISLNSPCIDAGDPDPQYNDPDQSRSDIGAIWFGGLELPYASGVNMAPDEMGHVMSYTPSFSWTYFDTTATTQQGYEIEVGTDPDWTSAEMWTPGQISNADSTVTYAGVPLAKGVSYWFRLRVNNGTTWGYWRVLSFTLNSPPSVPLPVFPISGDTVGSEFRLTVENSTDLQGDDLFYDYEAYSDPGLTVLAFEDLNHSGSPATSYSDWVYGLDALTQYYWRARAGDSYEKSEWSEVATFMTGDEAAPGNGYISLDSLPPAIAHNGLLTCGTYFSFDLRIHNYTDEYVTAITNGFRLFSDEGATWEPITGQWNPSINWSTIFDGGIFTSPFSANGSGADTVGFGAFKLFQPGYPSPNDDIAFLIMTSISCDAIGKEICLDSAFYPPSGVWLWSLSSSPSMTPDWNGPYCWTITSCCQGIRGNMNGSPDGGVDVADLSWFIDFLFGGGPGPICAEEADIDGSGFLDMSDLVFLVDYLFHGGPYPASCP